MSLSSCSSDSTWLDTTFLSKVLYCRTLPKYTSKDQYNCQKVRTRPDDLTMMSAKLHSSYKKRNESWPWGTMRTTQHTLTWALSHSKAGAWPMTNVDRLEGAEVSGLPSGPQELWSTDEGGFLRLAAVRKGQVITIVEIQEKSWL